MRATNTNKPGGGFGRVRKESKTDYKKLLVELVEKIDDSDERFLRQIYTILIRHLRRA